MYYERAKNAFADELYYLYHDKNLELMLSKERGGAWLDDLPEQLARLEKLKAWQHVIRAIKSADELRSLVGKVYKMIENDEADEGAARIYTLCQYGGVFNAEEWND